MFYIVLEGPGFRPLQTENYCQVTNVVFILLTLMLLPYLRQLIVGHIILTTATLMPLSFWTSKRLLILLTIPYYYLNLTVMV